MGRIHHTSPVPARPPARLLAVLVVLLALLAGCGGHSDKASKGSSPSSSPSPSTSDEPALDPGSGVAKVGQCFRMTAAQTMASVAAPARVNCRRPHTTVVAYVGYVAPGDHPGHPAGHPARAGPQGVRPRVPGARRRDPGRPGPVDPDVDVLHPGADRAASRRPLGALRRRGPQRQRPRAAPAGLAVPGPRGARAAAGVRDADGRRGRVHAGARLPRRGRLPGPGAAYPGSAPRSPATAATSCCAATAGSSSCPADRVGHRRPVRPLPGPDPAPAHAHP